jgi:hypothetical protein
VVLVKQEKKAMAAGTTEEMRELLGYSGDLDG